MAYKIIETCISCGLCLPACPIDAIEAGSPVYVINDTCCDFEDCLAVCPVDAIVPVDPEIEDVAQKILPESDRILPAVEP